ncbi:NAD-dependent epimerase/dehydratase family protein [Desulfoplanes sp. PS50]|jgi:nucleoside-diphosphate-sugar epimerase
MSHTILLTGATGFLGSHLLAALVKRGYNVIALKRSFSNTRRIDSLLNDIVVYDIDIVKIETIFRENSIDVVIHAATEYGRNVTNCLGDLVRTNILFACNILEKSLREGVQCFINTDTFFSKNNINYSHLAAYSLSKRHFHDWMKLLQCESSMKVVNMVVHHVYGHGDAPHKFVSSLLHAFLHGEPKIPMTPGEQQRDFVHVSDVVEAYMLLIEKIDELPGYVQFDVGSGQPTTIRNFALVLKNKVELVLRKSVPTTLKFGELPYREGEPMCSLADNKGLRNIGWEPKLSLEQGIEEMVREECTMLFQTEKADKFARD